MHIISFENVNKKYKNKKVLEDFSLDIEEGEFLVILGSPGSGKSVILRLLLGLEKFNTGRIVLRGHDASHVGIGERNIGYVPQSFALFPNMTVYENICYPLTFEKVEDKIMKEKVNVVSEMLNISNLLLKKPNQLSGGEKQRVAIARGIIKTNDIYVLDDPLVGLDYKLREQLQEDLRELQKKLGATFIYSTSDCLEAMGLADSIAVFSKGKCVEKGSPVKLYNEPKYLQTIKMVGFPSVNIFESKIEKDGNDLFIENNLFKVKIMEVSKNIIDPLKPYVACIKPEKVTFNSYENAKAYEFDVVLKENLGGEEILNLKYHDIELKSVINHAVSEKITGEKVILYLKPEDISVFSVENELFVARGVELL